MNLSELQQTKTESENMQTYYLTRWSKNWNLYKGNFREENTKSKIRNKHKTFFRKISSTIWRIIASLYNAFLRDPDTFEIEGRDTLDDPRKAGVLQKLTEYRRDKLFRHQSLFLKFTWAFQSILLNGWVCGKLGWDYQEDKDGNILKDGPGFVLYPNDQVFPDFAAQTKEDMRYIHFLNYLTKGQLKEMGFTNLDDLEVSVPDSNVYRSTRLQNEGDPLGNVDDSTNYSGWAAGGTLGGEYPEAGKYQGTEKESNIRRYKIYESFYKKDGQWYLCTHNNFREKLQKNGKVWEMASPYGSKIPAIMGTCLTEMFKLIGEGFPEPLESPQESYNYFLNMRKDNLALAMTGHTFVSRYGNVDIQSLINRRTGGITLMDDTNAVKHEQMPDVTRDAYLEAGADDAMMQEISGVTAGKVGMEKAEKATVAQINFTESNAKIDLYIALVGETFVKDFFSELARQIALFETDETALRVANEKYRQDSGDVFVYDEYNFGMEIDCIVNVGAGTVGREMELRQLFLAMDRGIMTLQAIGNLAQMGAMPPEGLRVPNIAKMYELALVKMGHKNLNDFFIQLQPPPVPQEGQGQGGALQPQVGGTTIPFDEQMIQEGSMGGI